MDFSARYDINLKTFSLSIAGSIKCYQCSSTEDQRKPTGDWATDQFTRNR